MITPTLMAGERTLLKLLQLAPDRTVEALREANLVPEDFADDRHRLIYQSMRELLSVRVSQQVVGENRRRTVIASFTWPDIEARLKSEGNLSKAGGREYLYTLPLAGLKDANPLSVLIQLRASREGVVNEAA